MPSSCLQVKNPLQEQHLEGSRNDQIQQIQKSR